MAQIIIIKSQIEQSKLDTLLFLLKSWGLDAETKTASAKRAKKNVPESDEKHVLFSKTFGMWEGRDIDLKQIRQQVSERRTNTQMVKDGAL